MASIDVGLYITAISNAAGALRETADGVKRIGDNAQATSNRLKAINVVIAGILINKVKEFATSFLEAAAATQLLDLRMASLAGSAKAATEIQRKLNDQFGATPFKIDTISNSWSKLRSVLGSNDEATRAVSAVINAVAALPGGTDTQISDVTTALQKMMATGKVDGRAFKAVLVEAGLSIKDLASAAGVAAPAFQRSIENGFMNASTFIDAFIKASETKFGDFAIKLGSSLSGAMNKISNDVNQALGRLGERGDFNIRLALAFKKIDEAVVSFIDHISDEDIDKFFVFLQKMEPTALAVGKAVLIVGEAVLTLAGIAAGFINAIPSEALPYGIIGYALFGKLGFGIGLLIGSVKNQVADFFNTVERSWNKPWGYAPLPPMPKDASKAKSTGIFGYSQADIDKARKDLAEVSNKMLGGNGSGIETTNKLADSLAKAAEMSTSLSDALRHANDELTTMNFETSGDKLGAQVSNITKETNNWKTAIQAAVSRATLFTQQTGIQVKGVSELKALLQVGGPIDQGLAAAVDKMTKLNALANSQFLAEQQVAQLQLQSQTRALNQSNNLGAGFNLLGGTPGGAFIQTLNTQRDQLVSEIADSNVKLISLQAQIVKLGSANPEKVASLRKTIDATKELQNASKVALKEMTVDAQLSKELWQSLGDTLNNDVASGISGLIDGTQTLGQVMRKVWSDITDLVIKYLLKLAEAKLMQDSMGSSSGGGLFSALFGSIAAGGGASAAGSSGISAGVSAAFLAANGAVIHGGIKPFANGGVINGPMMFGLAGEAGSEAIMPLTRGPDGKLGIRAHGNGHGGSNYTINIHAIDTQTGLEFLSKHIDHINNGLGHRRLLNRSGRTMP